MKNFAKITLGALVIAGASLAATTAADAQVSFGIGIGSPGYYGPPAYSYSCDRYSRWYDPYRCDYYAPSYYAPRYYAPRYYGPRFYVGGNFRGGRGDHDGGRGGDRGGRGGNRGHR